MVRTLRAELGVTQGTVPRGVKSSQPSLCAAIGRWSGRSDGIAMTWSSLTN
jgi:hypothetical protein